jgi:hypothetical protein
MESICEYLGVGKVSAGTDTVSNIKINSLNSVNIFISKFKEAQLLGAKAYDYVDFCEGIELINQKTHLTIEGFTTYFLPPSGGE